MWRECGQWGFKREILIRHFLDYIFRSNSWAVYDVLCRLWIDYARRLERIESLKAKGRMSDGGKGKENFPYLKGQTRDTVASKLGIGSGKQYEKEKVIVDNKDSLTPEDFAEWDEGNLSTNKAFQKIKEEKENIQIWYMQIQQIIQIQ